MSEASSLSLICKEVPLTNGPGIVPVQFQYSNAVHGPEGPIAQPHSPSGHGHKPAPSAGAGSSAHKA